MAEPKPDAALPKPHLEQGTYEILRARLAAHGAELRARLAKLNHARQEVFGAIDTALVATERVTTRNNCTPRDMIPIAPDRFLFGYNVLIGLRTETQLVDVFAVYQHSEHRFTELPLDALADPQFETDFKNLYKYYKNAVFAKFSLVGPHLWMEFRVGKSATDIKTFKWLCQDGRLAYLGSRFDHEYRYPPQHEFEWKRTHRDLHRSGLHPHISIEERVFVECVGGDLTIKVENNTASGRGIYAEPVENPDQTLDDAEIYYAVVGSLILLKVRPYQEKRPRYLVFNEKLREVRRIDAIEDSCVMLPDGHGIIFSCGYYLQSGEFKRFETALSEMVFYKLIPSPNGEDFLFSFYNRDTGAYVLLPYNLIERAVETPIICNGFSIFENGEMALFREDSQPQKHHAIQVWQTPFVGSSWQPETKPDSYLYKIGNPELVGAMAECNAVLNLVAKDDSYSGLYFDLVRKTTDILDSYFWLDRVEASDLRAPLGEIKHAAEGALAEFDKVASIKRSTAAEIERVTGKAASLLRSAAEEVFENIGQFVARLAEMRAVRGELISLKELRYADLPLIEKHEQDVATASDGLAQKTVEFLLQPTALEPYRIKVDALNTAVPALPKVTEAQRLEEEINTAARELDLLVETVTNLKIQDATETTRIVENVSAIYAIVNQARAGLKAKVRDLRGNEAVAEFASQTRLLDQALANYLDLSTTPEKCDEYLNRIMVQVEELEARFADFDEFVIQLSEKRTALSGAFESRKLELVETRNRKANALLTAAERILAGIRHRANGLPGIDELNSYFAADMMVEKVRDLTRQLLALGDTVKADDLTSRLKTAREDAVRQLKDRRDLFAGGSDAIQLGRHRFLVNTQELELTVVKRGETMCLHLTGTNFFEPITDEAFLTTRAVWDFEVVSETPEIYRGEYLAFRFFTHLRTQGKLEAAASWSGDERLAAVREFMAPRYSESYVKGVHDSDAARIASALVEMHAGLGLLRYPSDVRACAAVCWNHWFADDERKELLTAKLRGYGTMGQLFPSPAAPAPVLWELHQLLSEFARKTLLFSEEHLAEAAEYLYFQLRDGHDFTVSAGAHAVAADFERYLQERHFANAFRAARHAIERDLPGTIEMLRSWLRGHLAILGDPDKLPYLDEAAWLLLRGSLLTAHPSDAPIVRELDGLSGNHALIQSGKLRLHYIDFVRKMRRHEVTIVPLFQRYHAAKKQVVDSARERMRLENFKPKVLSSFVRNRLIDSAYLPLVGDNFAKQIGSAGDMKRTDRMGLLLLVSPPGYGKTTLVEYLASRLGVVWMKINGPAIGHRVTSLDPGDAPNTAARDELEKLNLAFEMGDNVMIVLDDIQHLNPEFLQKFISLTDGQRRIEGVYRGQPRTFDLRGKKVIVVMAGNPYTESGEKFQIPDMLANRADTYNLGDIVGAHLEVFKSSYVENAAGSNPMLARIAGRSQKDLVTLLQLAEGGAREGLDFEGSYSAEETAEFLSVMRKLLRVRDVVLRMNEEYIRSAAQADAYRTEPPFKLQGSYRNMNRLAEKVLPIMNDSELEALLADHYRNEAQTLTSGAEANLLKFKETAGSLTLEEAARWEDIKTTFRKNLLLHSEDGADPVGQVVQRLAAMYEGLDAIKEAVTAGVTQRPAPAPAVTLIIGSPGVKPPDSSTGTTGETLPESVREVSISEEVLQQIWTLIEQDRRAKNALSTALPPLPTPPGHSKQ